MGGGGEYSVPSAEDILMGGMPAMQQPMGDMRGPIGHGSSGRIADRSRATI
jgi:hypothetical protein